MTTLSPGSRLGPYVETSPGGIFVPPFRTGAGGDDLRAELGEGKWQVSREMGNWPIWRNPGETIFYSAPAGSSVFAVPVRTGDAAFESGSPVQLFTIPRNGLVNLGDSTPNGERFVMPNPDVDPAAGAGISVVLNWPSLLKR